MREAEIPRGPRATYCDRVPGVLGPTPDSRQPTAVSTCYFTYAGAISDPRGAMSTCGAVTLSRARESELESENIAVRRAGGGRMIAPQAIIDNMLLCPYAYVRVRRTSVRPHITHDAPLPLPSPNHGICVGKRWGREGEGEGAATRYRDHDTRPPRTNAACSFPNPSAHATLTWTVLADAGSD